MRPLVILNPCSQGGKTGAHAPELERVIERYVGPLDAEHTEHPRHAADIAERAAREGRPMIIVVGGDGTLHEVVHGLMRARDGGIAALPPVGLVGRGTGGDFRKTLGLEHRLDCYCRAIAGKVTRRVDVARMQYTDREGQRDNGFFVNILSAGMGGLVDEYVAQSSRRFGGSAAYLAASARALVENEVGNLACVLHDDQGTRELEIPTRLIAVCNGRYFGGGMEVAPMAEPDDGWLDVVSLGAAPRFRFALSTLSIYGGRHIRNPGVEIHRVRRIDIALRNESVRDVFLLDVDGEPLGKLPLSIEVVPGAIELFVPA